MSEITVAEKQEVIQPGKRRFRTTALWVGSILVVASTLGVMAALSVWKYQDVQAKMKTPPPPERPTAVGLKNAGTVSWRNSTTSIGTILAPRSITVNNELPGTVSQVLFQPGSTVDAGAILLQQDISVELAQLKATEAREAFAKSNLERNREIAQSAAVTKSELEDLESQWLQAKSQVEELNAIIARKTIKAPFSGRVGLTDTHEGQFLSAGSLITTLQSNEGYLLVDFMLPQGIDNQVRPGDSVIVQNAGQKSTATIQALDAQADRSTRNVRVRARLDSTPASISPGDSVQVKIEYGSEITLPGVPAEAVRRSPQGAFVFVAEKNESGALRATMRPVVPGTAVGSQIGLASGIKEGELVVVEGSFKLKDGMLIEPASPEQLRLNAPSQTGESGSTDPK